MMTTAHHIRRRRFMRRVSKGALWLFAAAIAVVGTFGLALLVPMVTGWPG